LIANGEYESGCNLVKEALEDAEESGKKYNKSEIFNQYVELLIDSQKYDEAIDLYLKEIKDPSDKFKE
jgi:hypothetical protein